MRSAASLRTDSTELLTSFGTLEAARATINARIFAPLSGTDGRPSRLRAVRQGDHTLPGIGSRFETWIKPAGLSIFDFHPPVL